MVEQGNVNRIKQHQQQQQLQESENNMEIKAIHT